MDEAPQRNPNEFLPVAEGARDLTISLRTMETLIANGDIPVARISRRVRRIRRGDLDAYIERVTSGPRPVRAAEGADQGT